MERNIACLMIKMGKEKKKKKTGAKGDIAPELRMKKNMGRQASITETSVVMLSNPFLDSQILQGLLLTFGPDCSHHTCYSDLRSFRLCQRHY